MKCESPDSERASVLLRGEGLQLPSQTHPPSKTRRDSRYWHLLFEGSSTMSRGEVYGDGNHSENVG